MIAEPNQIASLQAANHASSAPEAESERSEGSDCLSLPPITPPIALPNPADHEPLLDLWLENLAPLQLCERFDLTLTQLLAWARSPRTQRDLALLESIAELQQADLLPARRRTAIAALHTAAASHGCRLSPLELQTNESARRAATALLKQSPSPIQAAGASTRPPVFPSRGRKHAIPSPIPSPSGTGAPPVIPTPKRAPPRAPLHSPNMFDAINKTEFFGWWDRDLVDRQHRSIKGSRTPGSPASSRGSPGSASSRSAGARRACS
ncbi:MAG: hypothetical protein ACI89L_001776 [Phycisphaerales bacterium]|jgi:hypothetical protein